jgi:hypothetical protein
MTNLTINKAAEDPHELPRKVAPLIGWISLGVSIVSAIALATLVGLRYSGIMGQMSPLVIYLPCGGVGGISVCTGLAALCIYQCRQLENKRSPPDNLSTAEPPPTERQREVKTSPSIEVIEKREIQPENVATKRSPWEEQIDKIGLERTLHPQQVNLQAFSFEETELACISHTFSEQIAALPIEIASQVGEDSVHATRPRPLERQDHRAECASCQRKCEKCGLEQIEGSQEALACFLVTAGDFMSLEGDNAPNNASLSLSFMIRHLEELKKENIVDQQCLEKWVARLRLAYRFIGYQNQLLQVTTTHAYIQGRHELAKRMLETLTQEKSLLIAGGYADLPCGHFISLELFLREGMVSARLLNRGEGVDYHNTEEGIKVRYHPLLLSPVPLENLQQTRLLERLIDLQATSLLQTETAFDVEQQTHYTFMDPYETLMLLWPGTISSEETKTHSPQHGESCAIKPFLALMKEALGEIAGEVAQIYLHTAAIDALAQNVDFQQIHTDFVEDAVAKLNRRAVKLDRQGKLPQLLKQNLLNVSTKIEKQILQQRQAFNKQRDLSNSALESHETDIGLSSITPLPCTPIQTRKQQETYTSEEKPAEQSPELLLTSARDLTQKALAHNHMKQAVNIAYDALFSLPNPSDPCWQNQPLSGDHLNILFELVFIFLREKAAQQGGMTVSTHVAILMLKGVTLALRHAQLYHVKDAVIKMYGDALNSALGKTGYLYQASHPAYVKMWLDCKRFLAPYKTDAEVITLTKQWATLKNLLFINPQFESLSELRQQDVELCFLNDFLQSHPELKGTFLTTRNCTGHGIGDTMELHLDRSLFFKPEKPCAYQSVLSIYEPIRHWVCLRRLYHCFVLSAYVVGEVEAGRPSDFYFTFDTGNYRGRVGGEARFDSVGCFLLNDPQQLTQGLFLETDLALSKEMKQKLWEFYLPNNHTHQNAHLLQQMTVHWDQQLDLRPQEYQYLLSIQVYDSLRIPQLIGFFTQYFHRLKDPRLQAFFSHMLFGLNQKGSAFLLSEIMLSISDVKHQLIEFIKVALKKSQTVGWVETHDFLIRVLAQVTRFLAEAQPNSKLLKKTVNLWSETVRKRIDPPHSSAEMEMRTAAGCAIVVSCAPYFDLPKLNPLLDLCKEAHSKSEKLGSLANFKGQPQLTEDLQRGNFLLQSDRPTPQRFPRWIVDHDEYFFNQIFQVQEIGPNCYEFYGEEGACYRLTADYPQIRIYQQIQGQWHQHQIRSPFQGSGAGGPPCREEGYFTRDVRFWSALDGSQTLVFSNKSKQLLCRVTPQGVMHPKQENRILVTNYVSPLIERLRHLSPSREILVWKNNQQEWQCIEIPQLKLYFTYVDGKWRSSLHPGYFLDAHAWSPALEPYSHYVILRNTKGKRVAIMPNSGCVAKRHNLGKPTIAYKKVTSSLSLITIPLTKTGEIKLPDNGGNTIYLIYLALHKGDYRTAAHLIHVLKKERPEISAQECIWIDDLDIPKKERETRLDRHPEAIACRLQLRLLVKKLTATEPKDKKAWKLDYFLYLESQHHTSGARLSKQDEIKTIEILQKSMQLSAEKKYRLAVRRHLLTESALPSPLDQAGAPSWITQQLPLSFEWISEGVEKQMKQGLQRPRSPMLDARPGSALIDNFLYYYTIAKHLSPSHPLREQLNTFLHVSQGMSDVKLASLHTVLINVLMEPKRFPTLEELDQQPLKEMMGRLTPQLQQQRKSNFKNIIVSSRGNTSFCSLDPTLSPHTSKNGYDTTAIELTPAVNLIKLFQDQGYLEQQTSSAFEAQIQLDLNLLKEMEDFLSQCKDDNPCIKKEFDRLTEGVKAKRQKVLEQKNHPTPYLLCLTSIAQLGQELQNLGTQYQQLIEEKKRAILKIAHTYPDHLALEKNGRMLTPLSLRELIVHYGTGRDEAIYASNPDITPAKMGELKKLIGNYLILGTDYQQIIHLKKDWTVINRYLTMQGKDAPEITSLSVEFVKKAQAQRVYVPCKEPHLLVFEFFGKIRLRADQYQALMLMTGSEKDFELEARTGFGKSKVLIPLWLFLKGRRDKIAMMTVPSSLFIAQHRHLKKILGKAYDASIIPLQFNRSKANDVRYLRNMRKKLEDAKRQHKIVLTTLPSLHGMTNLKIKEALAVGHEKGSPDQQRELIALRTLVSTQIADFFDESKVCFQLRQRYDYAIGLPASVDKDQIKNAISLYQNVILQSPFHFEFLPDRASNSQPLPLQEEYETKLLPHLAAQVAKQFEIPPQLTKAILNDLQGYYTEECEKFYSILQSAQLANYHLLKKQLTVHMRRTLFRKCDDSYGFYPGTRVAIPYTDGTPKLTSEFSEVEDSIDFTIQINLKNPLKASDIEPFIDRLKIRSLEGDDIDNLLEWVKKISNCTLMQINENHCQALADRLNANMKLKLDYIEMAILPQIKTYKEKVTSTSFNLIRSIHHIQAASGIVDPDILPPRLKTEEDTTAVIDNLMALWKHTQNAIFKIPLKNVHDQPLDTPSKQLEWLLITRQEEHVLIDVAGAYLDLNRAIDAILVARPHLQGVVYHDDEGEEMVYERSSKMSLPREESVLTIDELFIFFRKSKVIGTDTEMDLAAKALVTVDRETWYTLLVQGSGRMRKLTACQRVCYVIFEEEANYVFNQKALQFKNLLEYSLRNQGRQKGEDNVYALQLYVEDLIDSRFWQAATRLGKDQLSHLFQQLRSFLVKNTQASGVHQKRERGKMPQKEAVKKIKSEAFALLERLVDKNPPLSSVFDLTTMKQEFDQFVDYSKLPKEMDLYAGDHQVNLVDGDVTHDQEEIQEEVQEATDEGITEQALENENFTDQVTELPKVHFNPEQPLPWDGDYISIFATAPKITLLGIPLYFSPNFDRVALLDFQNSQVQKPAYQSLIKLNRWGQYTLLLLDLHDANILFNQFTQAPLLHQSQDNFYLLSGHSVIATQGTLSLDLRADGMQPIHIICKLFTACTILTREEKSFLSNLAAEKLTPFLQYLNSLQQLWPHLCSFATQIPTLTQ